MLMLFFAIGVAAQEAPKPSPRDVLILHGINPDAVSILQYFEGGFSEQALLRGLPAEPREKTQVVIDALQVLGDLRANQAVDVLTQICEGQFPAGVRQAFRIDLQGVEGLLIQSRQSRLQDVVMYNTVVALGWIGDPKAAPAIKQLMESKEPTGFITQGALALGMMGDTSGLPKVIDLMETGNPGEQAGAARIFYYITGRYYDLGVETSVARHEAVIDDAKMWYAQMKENLEVSGAEVRRRRLDPYPPTSQEPDLTSIRGLCKTATRIVQDYRLSLAARQKLNDLGPESLPDLEEIARDPMADNDVRLEALRHYVRIAGKDSKKLLKDLDDDDNKPVAERAEYLRKNLDAYLERQLLIE
jgi:HEAT repeat protein